MHDHSSGDRQKCPECGEMMIQLPTIRFSYFEDAKRVADAAWSAASGHADQITVACLAGALLFKRAATNLRIPIHALESMAGIYLEIVHTMIARRREVAREQGRAN